MFHNMMDLADLLDKSRDFEPQIEESEGLYYLSDLGAACAPRAIQRQSNYVQFKGPQKSWSCALTQLRACLNTWPKFESRAALRVVRVKNHRHLALK